MIEVTYNVKKCKLTVKGHANSGEPGHDLVCASASILAYTLVANVENIAKIGYVRNPKIELGKGYTAVCCKPYSKYQSVVSVIFSSICAGFELLAANYPAYVRYTIE